MGWRGSRLKKTLRMEMSNEVRRRSARLQNEEEQAGVIIMD